MNLTDWEQLENKVTAPIVRAFGEHVKGIYQLRTIPWKMLFEGCAEIDLVVQSWDAWVTHVQAELEHFIERRGRINLFLHHPDKKYVRLQQANKERIARKKFDPRLEVLGTITRLEECIKRVLPNSTVEERAERLSVRYLKELNWYCAMRFGNRLLLSLYSHNHEVKFEEPFFLVRTDMFPEIGRWFADERVHLIEISEEPRWEAALTEAKRSR